MKRTVWRLLLLTSICATMLPVKGFAQSTLEHDATNLRGFHGSATRIRRSFQPEDEARAIFRQVLVAAGIADLEDQLRFRSSAETAKAEAGLTLKDGQEERYIFYNAAFMKEIVARTNNYWSHIAVLAHEVAHHVRFHTAEPDSDHTFELEADYETGFILRRMGASLQEAQSAYRSLPATGTKLHPSRERRMQSMTTGWTQGGGGSVEVPQPKDVPSASASVPASAPTSGDPAGSVRDPAGPVGQMRSVRIAMRPIIGAPDTIRELVGKQVVQSGERQLIRLINDPDAKGDYKLQGYIVASKEGSQIKVHYIWDLTNPSGKRVTRISGDETVPSSTKDPWVAVTATVTQTVADKVAAQLDTWLAANGWPAK